MKNYHFRYQNEFIFLFKFTFSIIFYSLNSFTKYYPLIFSNYFRTYLQSKIANLNLNLNESNLKVNCVNVLFIKFTFFEIVGVTFR